MDSVKLNRGLISGESLDNSGFARDVADKIKLKMREVAGRSGEKIFSVYVDKQ